MGIEEVGQLSICGRDADDRKIFRVVVCLWLFCS